MDEKTKQAIMNDLLKKVMNDVMDAVFRTVDASDAVIPDNRAHLIGSMGREMIHFGIMQIAITSAACSRNDDDSADPTLFDRRMACIKKHMLEYVDKTFDKCLAREREANAKEAPMQRSQ